MKKRPKISAQMPLVLVIICQNRWLKNTDHIQNYSVIVTLEHPNVVDLYSQVELRNRPRVKF
jgi:hypothetical protein